MEVLPLAKQAVRIATHPPVPIHASIVMLSLQLAPTLLTRIVPPPTSMEILTISITIMELAFRIVPVDIMPFQV
jgi:hypothetical protein